LWAHTRKKTGSYTHSTQKLARNWALTYTAHRYRREIGFLYVLYTNIGQELRSNIQCMETMEWNWVLTYTVHT